MVAIAAPKANPPLRKREEKAVTKAVVKEEKKVAPPALPKIEPRVTRRDI